MTSSPSARNFPKGSRAAAKRLAQEERLFRDSVNLADAAAQTGASEQRLMRLADQGTALAFSINGETRFPVWQLRSNELVPVVPEIGALAELFPGDIVGLNAWVHRPNQSLGDIQPAEALRSEGMSRVLMAVRAIGAAGT